MVIVWLLGLEDGLSLAPCLTYQTVTSHGLSTANGHRRTVSRVPFSFFLESGRPLTKTRRILGDVVFYKVLNTPMLLVSSADIILELTERRSSIYSDKPSMVIDELWVPPFSNAIFYNHGSQKVAADTNLSCPLSCSK